MQTRNDYKNLALSSLSGRWGDAAILTAVLFAIYYGCSFVLSLLVAGDVVLENIVSIAWSLVIIPIAWSFSVYMLNIARNGSRQPISALFDGFSDFGRLFTTLLLKQIYVCLWSLLFIVPGIIKYISYAMTDFVLKDHPDMKNNEAIEESMRLMEGHKLDFFLLELSFFGWAIAAVLTAGLGFLLLIPYMETTRAHFYEDLLAENLYADDFNSGGNGGNGGGYSQQLEELSFKQFKDKNW